MKILITGTRGLAQGVAVVARQQGHQITAVSRSTGHDIRKVDQWVQQFQDYDACINSAYDDSHQISVLEAFADLWRDHAHKQIISIGSIVADHARSQRELDHQYWPYRLHKQALQRACHSMMQDRACRIKLINFGAVDTDMVRHLSVPKMSVEQAGEYVMEMLMDPCMRRQDLWL